MRVWASTVLSCFQIIGNLLFPFIRIKICQNKCYSWCTVATALGTHSIRPYSCESRDFDMALMRPSFRCISARECLVSVSALFPLDFSSVDASGEVFKNICFSLFHVDWCLFSLPQIMLPCTEVQHKPYLVPLSTESCRKDGFLKLEKGRCYWSCLFF